MSTENSTQGTWRVCGHSTYPAKNTTVLACLDGKLRVLEVREEKPGHEDTFEACLYWEDPFNEGAEIEWSEVTHWMPLPPAPPPPVPFSIPLLGGPAEHG